MEEEQNPFQKMRKGIKAKKEQSMRKKLQEQLEGVTLNFPEGIKKIKPEKGRSNRTEELRWLSLPKIRKITYAI